MIGFYPNEIIIDDANANQHIEEVIDGSVMGRGYVPRDLNQYPYGSLRNIGPYNRHVYPRNEWSSRIKDQQQAKACLSDFRMIGNNGAPIPSLDQNGQGYCWAYSPASAFIVGRARDLQPYIRLSAHAVAWKIKRGRDEGGWNPLALEFAIENGYPDISAWPEKSMDGRQYDNAATWANAKNNVITEGIMELTPPVYDRNMTFDQLISCLIDNIPCPVDLPWWAHSVCAVDAIEFDTSLALSDINRWGIRIWNSWKDSWSAMGMGTLRGNKAVPGGATAVKVVTLAA